MVFPYAKWLLKDKPRNPRLPRAKGQQRIPVSEPSPFRHEYIAPVEESVTNLYEMSPVANGDIEDAWNEENSEEEPLYSLTKGVQNRKRAIKDLENVYLQRRYELDNDSPRWRDFLIYPMLIVWEGFLQLSRECCSRY